MSLVFLFKIICQPKSVKMTEIGTQIDSDRRLLEFESYENYLDALITFVDLGYLGNLNVAREIAELGYRCTGETLDRESFYKRLKAVRDLLFPIYRPYELTSELITPANPVMQELALRERSNRLKIISTIIFVRNLTRLKFEISGYIDYSERLEKENWLPYFEGKKKIWPRASDLAYYHWRTGKTCLNETPNYQPIIDPKQGLLFKHCRDRHLINVDPEAPSPDIRNLWRGEVTCRQHLPPGQESRVLDNNFIEIVDANNNDEYLDQHPDRKFDTRSVEHCQPEGKMASIVGTYQFERNENLDEYFKAVGVPYIARKMMGMSSPRMEILNDGEKWTIRIISMIRTVESTFTLGEEYEEHMPSGVTLKNVTTMEGDSLLTVSIGPDNNKMVRKHEVTEDGVVLTMTHEKSGQVAKRYFKRLS